ncbi:MAG: flagellar basal body P-ring protein FlgI, partial [Gammaproteobacteria bacterium]|nr:flagellar basal body P-ring protein FlgI [Gammaproteobacteria bacterium]
REVHTAFATSDAITLNLNQPVFTTANRLANRINGFLGIGTAEPIDSTSIRIAAPRTLAERISFVSVIENLDIMPGEAAAKVVVNSRTGTVVINSTVRVQPAAVSHGTLVVAITEDFDVSQPQPFSRGGRTVVTPDSQIDINQEDNPMFLFEPGVELNELVRAVNEVGASPGDLVAILEALKEAGALRANLIVI